MKWFLGLVLAVALVLGGLYVFGRLFLPNTLEVTSTTVVERPRASVFAMINDLNIAQEWSPYHARDPDAEYAISPTPGEGQTMRWNSNVREIGSGRMSILSSIQNESVESLIEIDDRATLNSRIDLTRRDRTTHVSWSINAACTSGWINVPCRYMNQIMASTIKAQLDSGLARLKDRAEQLPTQDFEGYLIEEVPVSPQVVIFVDVILNKGCLPQPQERQGQEGQCVREAPTIAERIQAEQRGVEALANSVATAGGQADNRVLVRVFPQVNGVEGRFQFSVGRPYQGPAPVLVGARVGQTPGGPMLRASVVGRRSQLPFMYQRIDAYRQAHRISLRQGAEYWEIVTAVPQPPGADPNDPVEQTEIFYPIEPTHASRRQ